MHIAINILHKIPGLDPIAINLIPPVHITYIFTHAMNSITTQLLIKIGKQFVECAMLD